MSKGDGCGKKRPETAWEKPNVWLVRSDSWIFVGHICCDIGIVSHWCLQLKSLGHKSRNHGFLSPIFPLVGPYSWDLDICFSKLRQGASGQPFGKVIIFSSISTNLTLVIPRCWSDILQYQIGKRSLFFNCDTNQLGDWNVLGLKILGWHLPHQKLEIG